MSKIEHADYIPAKKAEKKPVNTTTQTQWPPVVSFASGVWGTDFKSSRADKILEEMKTDKPRKKIQALRDAKRNNSTAYSKMKEALPAVRWSGKFSGLGKAGLVSYSGICCVDLDHVGDEKRIADVKATLSKSSHIIASFRSPSGDGIKCLVDVRGHNSKTHLLAWRKANELVKSLTGLPYDENTKDFSRICLASWDADLEAKWETTPIPLPTPDELSEIENAERRKEIRRAEKTDTVATSPYGRAVLDKCLERIRNAERGERNPKIYTNARTISEYVSGGEIAEEDGWNEGLEASLDIGDNPQKDQQTFENGWNDGMDNPQDRNSYSKESEFEEVALELSQSETKDETQVTIPVPVEFPKTFDLLAGKSAESKRTEEPMEVLNEPAKQSLTPWRDVKADEARKAIAGTALEPIVEALEMVTDPPLPLEMTLLKAIVLAGCALSGQDGTPKYQIEADHLKGIDLARVKIMTASGQVPNVYGVLVSGSATGKDIGGIMPWLAGKNDWYIGSGGSREGVLDALVAKPNGLFMLNEMGKLFDKFSFQAPIKELLTESFNRGFVEEILSQRTKIKRNAPYCYPNVFGCVQPETIARLARTEDVDSGFLGRMLFSYYERPQGEKRRRARNGDLSDYKHNANASLQLYKSVCGSFTVPETYAERLVEIFDNGRAGHESSYLRLASEYLPRIALMLSIPKESEGADWEPSETEGDGFCIFDQIDKTEDQRPSVLSEISQESLDKAETICLWFYAMAEKTLGGIRDNELQTQMDRWQKSIWRHIHNAKGSATISTISHNCSNSVPNKEDRRKMLDELIDRGWVVKSGTNLKAVKNKNLPPSWM